MGFWASKRAQQAGVLATKPDDLGSIPGISMVEGENSHKLCSDAHTHVIACAHTYTKYNGMNRQKERQAGYCWTRRLMHLEGGGRVIKGSRLALAIYQLCSLGYMRPCLKTDCVRQLSGAFNWEAETG